MRPAVAFHNHDERGFSLIELMVVILVVGILIAIAIPTFLGARERAQNRAAQTDLRTGLAAALTIWAESSSYLGFDVFAAVAAEPSLGWRPSGTNPQAGEIVIQVPGVADDGTELLLITRSRSGLYFCIRQLANSPVFDKGQGPTFETIDEVGDCTGGW